MTPAKVWDIRARDVPRDLWPDGRVRVPLRTTTERLADPRRQALEVLRGYGEWEVIRAVQDGQIEIADVQRALRRGSDEAGIARLRAQIVSVGMAGLPSVARVVESYLQHLDQAGVRPNTEAQRSYAFRSVLRADPEMAALGIDALSSDRLARAIRSVSASDNTREGIRSAWSALYTWSIDREHRAAREGHRAMRYEENPARAIASWKGRARPETASEAQVAAILGAANLYREAYVRALVQLGLRQGELRHTRLHLDLDVDAWTWKIQPRSGGTGCGCRTCRAGGWRPKTARSERELLVPAGVKLRRSILAMLDAYPAGEGEYAFRRPDGDPWRADSLARDFRALAVRAGVKYGRNVEGGLTLHTLRHTCATNLIRSGVDSSIVAAILGDSVQTVVRVYVHLMPDDLARGVASGPSW